MWTEINLVRAEKIQHNACVFSNAQVSRWEINLIICKKKFIGLFETKMECLKLLFFLPSKLTILVERSIQSTNYHLYWGSQFWQSRGNRSAWKEIWQTFCQSDFWFSRSNCLYMGWFWVFENGQFDSHNSSSLQNFQCDSGKEKF